jgi:hypothetical protein
MAMSKAKLSVFIVICALIALVAVMPAAAQSGEAMLRFVHALPGASAIDVYIDGELTLRELDFGEASLYITVSDGSHVVTATQTGVTTALWQQDIPAPASTSQTLIVSSTEPLGFQAFQDDLNPLALGEARLTALHAIAGGPTVDLILADGRAVIPSLEYNLPYGTLDVPVGAYDVAVVPTGESIENAIIDITTLKLNSGSSYLGIAYGTTSAPQLMLLSAMAMPSIDGSFDGGFVRISHGLSEVGAVDVYANDTLIVPSLAFEETTNFIPLPTGSYDIAVTAAGDTTALLTATVAVESGVYATAIALEQEGEPTVAVFVDDVADANDADSAVINVINASDVSSTVELEDGSLVSEVESDSNSAITTPTLR